jgi:hypothetical protein
MLNGTAGINYSDTETFIEYFGEKWLQQWRERLGKHASWISVLGMGERREELASAFVYHCRL